MPLLSSPFITASELSPIAGDAVLRFRHQPTLMSVAASLAADALARLDPPVQLDPGDVAIGWPAEVSATGETQHLALPELLIDLFVRRAILTLVPGYQRALQRQGEQWVPLLVDLSRLIEELDAARPFLLTAFEEALAHFWSQADPGGQTHWAWMAGYLRRAFAQALDVARENDSMPPTAYAAGMALARHVEGDTGQGQYAPGLASACLLQLQSKSVVAPFDPRLDPYLLISIGQPERFIAFSPSTGAGYYPSRDALLGGLRERFAADADATGWQLQPVRVEGNIFDALARTLLQTELIQLRGLTAGLPPSPQNFAGREFMINSDAVTGLFVLDAQINQGTRRWLQQRLPAWLQRASATDRWQFAAALATVGVSQPSAAGSWFLEGIPPLEAYALSELRNAAARAHPEAPALQPENIQASVTYVVQDLLAVTGGPWEPQFQEDPVSVTDLVIDNLAAHSRGWLTVKAKPGTTLPGWLDGPALKALVQQIDVGRTYPHMLRERLLEGEEAAGRRQLFCQQMVLQLPLLAWELCLRGAGGLDRQGYWLVVAGLGVHPSTDGTRLRALGVTAGDGYGTDTIAATYVFTKEGNAAGPVVLYRPLHTDQLRQFPTLNALWDDLAAPGELQDEALRWMTDLGRTRYSHGGWREPRVMRFGQGDEFAPLQHPAPAQPVLTPLAAPTQQALYQDVVRAIIERAEQRSVSNAEDRWASLGRLADLLFTGLLPVFNGPLATAGWLLQLSEQFNTYLQAGDQSAPEQQDARDNLLFNIALLLVSEAVRWPIDRPQPGVREPGGEAGGEPFGNAEAGAGEATTRLPGDPPAAAGTRLEGTAGGRVTLAPEPVDETAGPPNMASLDLAWASASLALGPREQQALAGLRALPPQERLSPIPHGPSQGFYFHDNRLLVRWQDHFYGVDLQGDAPRIVGPTGEPGPWLRRDEAGRWTPDLRLRLRGGGPKRRIEARRQQNEENRAQAERLFASAVPAFDALRDRVNPLAEQVDQAALANEPQVERRQTLDRLLREGYETCAGLVDRYEAVQALTPLPDFAQRMTALLARLLHISHSINENLSALTREFLHASPLFHAGHIDQAIAADLPGWRAFLAEFEALTQRALTFAQIHQRTVARLELFPGIGARTLAANSSSVRLAHSIPELSSSLTYVHLSQALEPLRDAPAVAGQMSAALEPVLVHSASHAEAADDPGLAAEDRLRVFDSAILQYQRGEDAIRAFRETLPAVQQSPALERLEVVIGSLRGDAERRLGELVRARLSDAPGLPRRGGQAQARGRGPASARPGASGTATGGSQAATGTADNAVGSDEAQVIDTAEGESVAVHVRTEPGSQARIAEVQGSGRVLARWRQDPATGAWHKPAATPPRQPRNVRLNALMREANQSLATARTEIRQARRLKQATRVPVDLQDLYHGRAGQLESLAEQIEQALTRINETDVVTEEHGSAEVKARALRDQAMESRRVGTEARIEVSKRLMPTPGRVEFLLEAGEVSIRRLGQRAPLNREGRRDFVQEYEILDRDGHALWYAHFHYDTATAAAGDYTAAHLKTLSQRFDGYQRQLQQARNDQEVVSIYRSRIDPVLARKLFLSLP